MCEVGLIYRKQFGFCDLPDATEDSRGWQRRTGTYP